MGLFTGIDKAQYFEGGKYITPGLFLVEIEKVKNDKTRKGRPFFVVEMKVLESSNLKDHPVGTSMSWMVMLDQDAALGNIKHFLTIACDVPENDVDEALATEACGEDNPLRGTKLRVSAVNILTREKKDFTKVKFFSADTSAADMQRYHASEAAGN